MNNKPIVISDGEVKSLERFVERMRETGSAMTEPFHNTTDKLIAHYQATKDMTWRSVDDAPIFSGDVLVSASLLGVNTANYSSIEGWHIHRFPDQEGAITHWMPLPPTITDQAINEGE